MKDILTAPFLTELCEMTANMYRLGWDERNGGNISQLLEPGEVAEYLDLDTCLRRIRSSLTLLPWPAGSSSSQGPENILKT